MPQAPAHLSHLNEVKCHDILAANFREICGVYYPKVEGYKETKEEGDALDYMVLEWDYGYSAELPKSIQG